MWSPRSSAIILCLLAVVLPVFLEASADHKKEKRYVECKGDNCPKSKTVELNPFRPKSCIEYYIPGKTTCGIYRLYDNYGYSYPVYCDFTSEPGTAWTLVMSYSQKFRGLSQFTKTPFKFNAPVNENAQNWNVYRLSLRRIKSLKAHSTHWRATCSYPSHGVDFTDYVRGNFEDFNIFDFLGNGECKKVEYVNIRGHLGVHTTAKFWQVASALSLHIDSSAAGCGFNPTAGALVSEDNFGFYAVTNHKFRCTGGEGSTTQWWFGSHL